MNASQRANKVHALADLRQGDTVPVVAERYRFNVTTVQRWQREQVTTLDTSAPSQTATYEDIGRLILQTLRAKLLATQRIAEHVHNPEWLAQQHAAGLAALLEVLDESATRMLARLATPQLTLTDIEQMSDDELTAFIQQHTTP